ncbi:Aminomethyltransferase [Sinomonas atrocyanea]|uniref:Aminomethyltransferase n=1 Tax=Sinomonas atrocyanea TaxID=37927 RepID=A0A126ZXY9_9MICC|nr:glycine cleavage system aminomethyltransferase GcvT [Sinomonas atrocyanea]AMM31746.1 Aminomethyltransferase [Sinomonas atrocyanea]GEB66610.1 aminomethyltransferase [Sinomonas atrocyanea]GGG80568.1 aminomethyltransferase [Sinomonas atrocyanea]
MTETTTEKRTALYAEHAALGAAFTDFGGWQMPLKYGSELAEHRAVRDAAGLFDLSHMGEVWATGPGAAAFLDYALVGKLSAIAVGKAKYSLICAEDGGIIDDLIVYRVAEEDFLVVPNAGNAATVAAELASRLEAFTAADAGAAAGAVALRDASAETSLIAVQGPNAEAILLSVAGSEDHEDIRQLKYYAGIEATIAGVPVFLARTGYTGEDGFELFVGNELAAQLWAALREAGQAHGLIPCGLAARDSLRLEAGMPLYGNELSREGSPFSAGLGGVVALTSKEGDFVGRAALEAKKAAGEGTTSGRRLVGLKGLGRRAARAHYPILKDGVVVGEVTSGQPSPTLGYPVALAYVDIEHAEVGTALDADLRGKAEPFEVVALPFYKRQK